MDSLPSDFSPFADALKKHYGFSRASWQANLGGLSATNLQFETDRGPFVVKIHGAWAVRGLARTHALIEQVRQRGILTPRVLRTVSGTQSVRVRGQIISVLEYLPGRVLHQGDFSPQQMVKVAALLADLHTVDAQHLPTLSSPRRRLRTADNLRKEAAQLFAAATESLPAHITALLHKSVAVKQQILSLLPPASLRYMEMHRQLVHGDFHTENVLFCDDGRIAILDWEDACTGHGIYDAMAWTQFSCFNRGLQADGAELAEHFMATYLQRCPSAVDVLANSFRRFYAEMAASLFFEQRLAAGVQHYQVEIQRDLDKMNFFVERGDEALATLFGQATARHAEVRVKALGPKGPGLLGHSVSDA